MVLTPEQVWLFRLAGFVKLPETLPPPTVAALKAAIQEDIDRAEEPVVRNREGRIVRLSNVLGRAPVFREVATSPLVLEPLADLLGHLPEPVGHRPVGVGHALQPVRAARGAALRRCRPRAARRGSAGARAGVTAKRGSTARARSTNRRTASYRSAPPPAAAAGRRAPRARPGMAGRRTGPARARRLS